MAFLLPGRRPPPAPSRYTEAERWDRLDERRRSLVDLDHTEWRPAKRRSSGVGAFVLAAAIGLGAGYLMRTGYDATPAPTRPASRTSAPSAPPPEPQRAATAPTRCSDPDGTIHGWQGNGTGVTPHDWFHFLPPCDGRRP